jgi:lipopolysaccharide/colanic/teichoic acid biosynthesis glycosyltransferase
MSAPRPRVASRAPEKPTTFSSPAFGYTRAQPQSGETASRNRPGAFAFQRVTADSQPLAGIWTVKNARAELPRGWCDSYMRNGVTRNADVEIDAVETRAVAAYPQLTGFAYAVKGGIDRIAAALLLVVLVIPMLVIAALIKLTSPGNVLVRQDRVGRYGHPFTFYKFRSMRADAEILRDELEGDNHHDAKHMFKIKRDPRITRVGGFLRRTSIDELPNVFNVLRGEMSLIGPRPPLPREVVHYDDYHMQRLAATPGLTGLWQIRGRSEIPFEKMVDMDLEYIERWSLWLDVMILLKTPLAVLHGTGAW